MGVISRREKKLAQQTLRTQERMKQQEGMMAQDPHSSYKRKTVYTHMPWPLELILMGRSDVLMLIILMVVVFIAGVVIILYYGINWLTDVLGGFWPW